MISQKITKFVLWMEIFEWSHQTYQNCKKYHLPKHTCIVNYCAQVHNSPRSQESGGGNVGWSMQPLEGGIQDHRWWEENWNLINATTRVRNSDLCIQMELFWYKVLYQVHQWDYGLALTQGYRSDLISQHWGEFATFAQTVAIRDHMCLAPFYLAPEKRWILLPVYLAILYFLLTERVTSTGLLILLATQNPEKKQSPELATIRNATPKKWQSPQYHTPSPGSSSACCWGWPPPRPSLTRPSQSAVWNSPLV